MRKLVVIISGVFAIVFSFAVFSQIATTKPVVEAASKKPVENKTENKTENKPIENTIKLYETPDANSKVISTLAANADLVAIYHQGDWMKVGDRQNGATGWINLTQYHQAKQDFYRNFFQTNMNSTYIYTSKDKDGKTITEAYQNGKKLSDADAKKLYDQMQTQEQNQWHQMQHFNQVMDQQMQMDYLNARRAMDAAFQMMPGIVVIEKSAPVDSKKAEVENPKK